MHAPETKTPGLQAEKALHAPGTNAAATLSNGVHVQGGAATSIPAAGEIYETTSAGEGGGLAGTPPPPLHSPLQTPFQNLMPAGSVPLSPLTSPTTLTGLQPETELSLQLPPGQVSAAPNSTAPSNAGTGSLPPATVPSAGGGRGMAPCASGPGRASLWFSSEGGNPYLTGVKAYRTGVFR